MRRLIPWAACHLMLWCCLVSAQEPISPVAHAEEAPAKTLPATEPHSPSSTPPATSDSGRIQELQPPVYYVEDASGKLVPMFGFKFEDFMKAFNQMQGLATETPPSRYVLRKMSAVGQIEADRATLTVQLDLLPRHDGLIRVPLNFSRAVVQGSVRHEGPVRHGDKEQPLLEFEEEGDGYVCWIRGKANEQHQLTFNLLLPLTTVGDETRLRFGAPRATRSELSLTVPLAGAVGRVSEGATLRTETPKDKKTTQFVAEGFRGHFELAWHKPEVRAAETPTVMEAVGEILAKIDDHSINTEATLRVRGHGEPLDRFRVRLPIGAELLATNPSGYSVAEVATDDAAASDGRLVEIQLRKKTTGPVSVRLATRRSHDKPQSAEWIELAGFEVIGAARQSGHVAVEVAGDLYVSWDPKLGVQQVEQLPDTLRQKDLAAGFEYFVQPYSLKARAVPRKTRISVEPEYLLLVDAQQVRLEATLKYAVRGKKALVLGVAMGDWEFDEVGPENLVAVDGVELTESGLLSIPLLQPSTGEIELKVKAHRRIAQENEPLRLTFPQPQVTSPGPAAVVILPADNVQLTPDVASTVGLVRQEVVPPMKLPKRQQAPLFYRSEVAQASLVAQRVVHAQAIAVNVRSRITLEGRSGRVEQRMSYKIDYEPQGKLTVEVPRSLVGLEGLEFHLDGQKLPPTAISEGVQPKQNDPKASVRMQIALRSARIGVCELTLRYPLKPSNLVPKSAILRTVPLVMPLDGHLSGNNLVVTGTPELQLKPPQGPWKAKADAMKPDGQASTPGPRSELELIAAERVGEVELGVYLESLGVSGGTVVQRAWVQTWLTQTGRQDRALFRFTTDRKEIEIVLPGDSEQTEVDFYLDGRPIKPKAATRNPLVISLPERVTERERLLEVRFHCPNSRPRRGRFELDLPRLGTDTWTRRMYWQLTLPPDEHVVNNPPGFVCEFRWGWNGVFWGREPWLGQKELETWIGTSHVEDASAGTNCYLFSTLGEATGGELRTASRSWIVLGASGLALVAGLLLIYVPASRHPASLFVVAVVCGCTGMLYPEPTLLVLQAASLGLGLTLLAGLLERGMARRRRGLTVLDGSSSILDKDSTQTQYLPPVVGNEESTETGLAKKPGSMEEPVGHDP